MTDFDARAKTWDSDGRRERAAQVAARLLADVDTTGVQRALEYGCGTGLLSFELADKLPCVVLADTSQGMLDVAEEKIAASGVDHFCTALLDLAADGLPSDMPPFQLIYSMLTLHHIPDTAGVLTAFFHALTPGGKLVLIDLDAEDGSFHGPDVDVHHGFDRDRLRQQMQAAGFVSVTVNDCINLSRGAGDYGVFLASGTRPA